jgi:hypothetical protein
MSIAYAANRFFKDRATNLAAASVESAITDFVVAAEPADTHLCDGWAGCRVRFFGASFNGDDNTIQVYTLHTAKVGLEADAQIDEWYITRWCQIVANGGTETGTGGYTATTDEFADGIALTDVGNLGVDAALGLDTAVYNSTGNDMGELVIGNLGGAYKMMLRYTTINSTNVNALIMPLISV